MNIQTPPTLLQLAGESLLRNQASAIAALEYLPAALFPPLFIQTYRRRIWELLKAMVHAWPFTFLPLGCLSHLSLNEALKAVLDELDILFAQERTSVQEFMTFTSQLIVELSAKGNRASVKEQEYLCHVYVQNDSLAGVVIADSEYPSQVAFTLLEKVLDHSS
ncbi:Synaptobrevin like protein YKT6 [Myotis davidii]|uniref:Synaptobrevin like protein YKT6 n=1 Tax=Myotis davidii TaxID=225400 RepID=L5M8L8_MYODS|nr:Synaptobrevin like protein YKT6 [Myotis davidii]